MVVRRRVQQFFDEPSLTHQSFKDQCDINKVMARFKRTGVIDHVSCKSPQFGDFSDVKSYQEALDLVQIAEEGFSSVPSFIRARFSNDPVQLLSFLEDPSNREEAIKLGLIPSIQEPLKEGDGKAPDVSSASKN